MEERQAKNKVTNKQQQQITITKTHTTTNSKGTHPEDWVINIHGVWIHQNKIHELRATNKITNKNQTMKTNSTTNIKRKNLYNG